MPERPPSPVAIVGRRVLVAAGALVLLYLGIDRPQAARARHSASEIRVGSVATRGLRAGEGDTTLLFLHGYGESLMSWRLILDRFTPAYRVLALDLPGFGLSDKPDTTYNLAFYRNWLGQVLAAETTGPVVVVGHSMGGELAATLALDHPERVVAAVLMAPAGMGVNPLLVDTSGVASPATGWVASAIAYVLPVHDSTWLRESPQAMRYSPAGDPLATRAAERILAEFDFAGLRDEYAELRQPVLLLWGRLDPTIPVALGDSLAARLPCRRYVLLPTLHRPHQTVPDTVSAEMLRFLAGPACDSPGAT